MICKYYSYLSDLNIYQICPIKIESKIEQLFIFSFKVTDLKFVDVFEDEKRKFSSERMGYCALYSDMSSKIEACVRQKNQCLQIKIT